ncbi:MAG TPA: hypothetical protein DEF34_12935 [Desulfotomaculum sp.]|nr:MAG: hypothetical protein VR67_01830 [Peptococcaceae bacterium BRH_c8a]KJS75339.1 MAG: hypothetical protein JL56_08265 [Desulfotomaculum sp. BICA1-6]HBX24516.1 hypothetical protein [Desulfotomaculum sp.]
MGSNLIGSLGLNMTFFAQILNLIILAVFLILPIILLVYLFSAINDIKHRVRNIENILMHIKEASNCK